MRKIFLNIVVLVLAIAGMVGCSKNDSNQPGPTHMRWINVTPGMGFDIYSNREELYNNLKFDSLTPYAYGLPSFYYLQIKKTNTSDTIISGYQQLQSGAYYTMFLVPDTTNGQISTTSASVATITDNVSIPSVDSVKLRFFNLAPFTNPINVVMTIDGRTRPTDTLRPYIFQQRIFNDQASYSSYTGYVQMLAFNWKIHFYNSKDSLIKFFYASQFRSQGIYTLYLKGREGVTTKDSFDYSLFQSSY